MPDDEPDDIADDEPDDIMPPVQPTNSDAVAASAEA
jgi:hypothetical protein